jgi:hypothetical protein
MLCHEKKKRDRNYSAIHFEQRRYKFSLNGVKGKGKDRVHPSTGHEDPEGK